MPPPPKRGRLECWQCGHALEKRSGRSLDGALACAIATLLLLLPANLMPAMTVHIAGISRSTFLASGLATIWSQHWPLVTIALGAVGIILPFIRFGLLAGTLAAIRLGVRGRWVGAAFRYSEILDIWAMVDVLLIGAGIGYGRIESQIPVTIDPGGWCFVVAAVMTMITRATTERRAVWRHLEMPPRDPGPNPVACTSCCLVLPRRAVGHHCPRCNARIWRRRPNAMLQCAALTAATFVLTPIAYGFPMSEFWSAGSVAPHSVIDGILLLFTHGFWYFGVVIFMVSLVFPLTKLVVLTWCVGTVHFGWSTHLRFKTEMYRFVDDVGRWSMLDPFAVLIFVPLGQFGQIAHIAVMGGTPAFLSTVMLSMVAARAFDPRLMWDTARARAKRRVAAPAVARV